MLSQTKSPFLSRGVIGGGIALLVGLVQMIGYTVTPADAANLETAVIGLITSAAGATAILGRIKATKRIALG